MVVSRSAADRFWPGRSPITRQIAFNATPQQHPVVGEVNDTREVSLTTSPEPIVYVSMRRYAKLFHTMTLVVRGRGSEAVLVSTIRGVLRDIDPTLALYNVQAMTSIVDQSTSAWPQHELPRIPQLPLTND